MNENLLKFAANDDEKNLISRIADVVNVVKINDYTKSIAFLNEREQVIAAKVLNALKADYLFWGGYNDAERKLLIIKSSYYEYEEYEIPIKIIRLSGKMISTLSHRDFLGSLMSFGIKRNVIGDIVKSGEYVYIFCLSEISDYIINQIDKIGNIRVKAEYCDINLVSIEPKRFKEYNLIVSSMRIDCIIAAFLGISRQDSTKMINSSLVTINWEVVTNISKNVEVKEIISVKGYGRMFIDEVCGNTKKGRIVIKGKKYI